MRIRCVVLVVGLLVAAGPATAGPPSTPAESGPPAPPAAAPAPTAGGAEADEPGVRVGWSKGKTVLEAPGVRLELSNRLQLRWTGNWPEDDDSIATGSFRIRRAKTKLTGWAYDERIGFGLQLNWANSAAVLEDAFIELDATGGGALVVQMGQYKVPFGRQELTSSGNQQFVDRSITSNRFARGRDVGLMLHGALAHGKLSWAAGLFNGSGPLATRNEDGRYQFDARVQLAPNGDPGYSEGDLESRDRPLYAVAVQYEHNDQGLGDERRELDTWGADATFKFRGASLFAEYFSARTDPVGRDRLENDGFTLQAGYMMAGRRLELAGRYARWKVGPGDHRSESGAALNWYREAHRLKLQTDLRFLDGGAQGPDDTELRVQAQLVF